MCLAALHWAQVATVYYGATVDDAQAAGFVGMQIPAAEIARLGGARLQLVGRFMRPQCVELFDVWKRRPDSPTY